MARFQIGLSGERWLAGHVEVGPDGESLIFEGDHDVLREYLVPDPELVAAGLITPDPTWGKLVALMRRGSWRWRRIEGVQEHPGHGDQKVHSPHKGGGRVPKGRKSFVDGAKSTAVVKARDGSYAVVVKGGRSKSGFQVADRGLTRDEALSYANHLAGGGDPGSTAGHRDSTTVPRADAPGRAAGVAPSGGEFRRHLLGAIEAGDHDAVIDGIAAVVAGKRVGEFRSGDTNNEAVEAVYDQFGYTGSATTVDPDTLDKMVRGGKQGGHTGLVRGVGTPEFNEAVREGDYYAGAGAYGSGIYTAVYDEAGVAVAFSYANEKGSGGAVARMALDKDANLIHGAHVSDFYHEKVSPVSGRLLDRIRDLPNGPEQDALWAVSSVLSDQGFVAALMGADGIYAGHASGTQYIVVLNRTKLYTDRNDYPTGRGDRSRFPKPPQERATSMNSKIYRKGRGTP